MQTDLLKLLCRKNQLSYIIFNSDFKIVEVENIDVNIGSKVEDFLWEIVGLEENILMLSQTKESIEIPMILRDGIYYDLEIEPFTKVDEQHFIAFMQKRSTDSDSYANVIKEINKKTLVYEMSDAKKESDAYRLINKRLLTFHVDLDGIITMVNDACTHFFNLQKDAMHKKHFSDFFHTQKSQLDNTTNIFVAKNSLGEDIFFHADIIPITDSMGNVKENIIIAQDVSHLKRIKKALEYAQEHDTLTGLANRHTFLKAIDSLIDKEDSFCIAFIDIDNFHVINEEYGAHAGDMLLKHLAQLLEEFIEQADMLMRIHADSFAIIFEAQKSREYIEAVIEKLKELASANPLYYNSEDIIEFNFTTLKLCYPEDAKDAKEFLSRCQKEIKREKIKKAQLHS